MRARCFHDHRGDVAPSEFSQQRSGIVRRDDVREIAKRFGDADWRLGRAVRVEIWAHDIGPAVEMVLELHDAVPTRRRPRDAQREHHRFGAGCCEADLLRRRDQRGDQLGPFDLERVRGAVMGAVSDLLSHRLDDGGIRVTEQQRAVTHRVVDELGAVDQPLSGATRARDVDAWVVCPRGMCRAAREHPARAFTQVGVSARMHGLGHRHVVRIPGIWRRRWESNPRSGFCRPVPYHLATSPRIRSAPLSPTGALRQP